ncbi:WD40/YVTN/BNR-like repeat-containing protein [Lysobacter sp. TAF61]|uniref:WD40/YVTN/BNR-like repeat-containing protein n=1 Tax=Lysobacter sp. TAF61 TaxID=3233072 RepID=UPI003F962885
MSHPCPRLRAPLLVLVGALALPTGATGPLSDPAFLPADVTRHGEGALLLDAGLVGHAYVAVGERGLVLLSGDGQAWRQAVRVPTRSTLVAIASVGDSVWAAGHDGVIVHSSNAGRSWVRQRAAPWTADDADPAHGTPVLDLLFVDARHGFAIGAYSLLLETHDGGRTWVTQTLPGGGDDTQAAQPVVLAVPTAPATADWVFSDDQLELGDESDPHLNAIARTGSGGLVIVGERGSVYRSRDDGATWVRGKLPYNGSMFGVIGWSGEHVLAFGMRGKVFESRDLGTSWTAVESGVATALMGAVALPEGGAVLVGADGVVLRRDRGDAGFRRLTHTVRTGETPTLAAALPVAGNAVLVFGDRGVGRVAMTVPAP